ncbi:MAG: hypothetical protein CMN58_05130 [Solibacterales bacterium]|nr:hypothetical protein [Bryobacterales bacterium]|tara:strand:+ start:579 stop:1334 length:756 start_codon:yes stop_codon:yes gene_type:complete
MNPDIPIVRELQLVDCRIRELTEEIARLPRYIAEIENKLESHEIALSKDQAILEENRKDRRLMDGKISTYEQKMSQLRVQMGEAKTNTQFRAFQKEIEFSKNEIRKTEDSILDKMVEAEKLETNVEIAKKALQAEKQVVAKEVERTTARVSKDEHELAAVRNDREQLITGISPQVLALYTRVSKTRQGVAVASVSDERCMACNVVLRPHLTQKLRLGEEILTCESCGRILYRGNLQETPLEDPASGSNIVA